MLDFLNRQVASFLEVTAELANDFQLPLPHVRRAMHHQVRIKNLLMDGGDTVCRQNVAGGLAAELVGAVADANRNRQRIDAGLLHKTLRSVSTIL